ncbi:MAG: NADH-quinone oxidoreductase subunit J [Vampirovibrionales bacterium]
MIESLFYWIFALLALGGAAFVVLHPNVVYSALGLLLTFMMVAGIFALNNADFVAISQVLVYAVGLVIVMLFALMFTGTSQSQFSTYIPKSRFVPLSILAGLFLVLIVCVLQGQFLPVVDVKSAQVQQFTQLIAKEGTTASLGVLLFSKYLLPFEIASILLTATMVGALMISRKEEPSQETCEAPQATEGKPEPLLKLFDDAPLS